MDDTPRRKRRDVLHSTAGRFHEDPDREPTSYAADSLFTAWREVTARFGRARVNPAVFRAWRLRVKGGRISDLRKAAERKRLGIAEEELIRDPWRPECRDVARRLRAKGYSGLLYKSVRNRPKGVCIALFLEHADKRIGVQAIDEKAWQRFLVGFARSSGR